MISPTLRPASSSLVLATSTPISLQISQGPETKTAEVPDLGGLSLEKARTKLEEAGLKEMCIRDRVSSTFNRYSRVYSHRGITAAQVARNILDENGLYDVQVQRVAGSLTDHYDPRSNVVRLSDSVYTSTSIAARCV